MVISLVILDLRLCGLMEIKDDTVENVLGLIKESTIKKEENKD